MKAFNVTESWIGGTSYGWLKLLPEAIRLLNKNTVPEMGYLLMNCWLPTQYKPFHCCWLPTKTRWWGPIAEDSTCFGGRTWGNKAGPHLEASSLLARFHGARRCRAGHRGRIVITNLTQLWTLTAVILTCQAQSARDAIVVWPLGGNHFPIGLEVLAIGGN